MSKKESNDYIRNLMKHALHYHKEGLSVIPLQFKDKAAMIKWRSYQKERPTAIKLAKWFSKQLNIAVICGTVSENLVVLDFDDKGKYNEFVNILDSNLREVILATRTVITGKGVHVYLRVDTDEETFKKHFRSKRSEKWKLDFQSEGKYVVAPPSIHPSGKAYEFKDGLKDIKRISVEEMIKIQEILFPKEHKREKRENIKASNKAPTHTTAIKRKNRALTDADMLEIATLLANAYKEGFRNDIVYALSGWLAKAGIRENDAIKIASLLAQKGKDPDYDTPEFKKRIDVIHRSYRKWSQGTNVSGKSYLIEVLERALKREEDIIQLVKDLEEKIGIPSKSLGMIFAAEDESSGLVYYADFSKKYIARGQFILERFGKRKFVKKGRIIEAVPVRVVRYIDPISGTENLDVVFESALSPVPLSLESVERKDLLAVLRKNGYVVKNRIAEDALNAVLNKMIRTGMVETKTEFSKTGIFSYQGEMQYTKIKLPPEVSPEELQEGLKILDELVRKWYSGEQEKFVTVLKWSIVAPWAFMQKQQGHWLPWLFLVGAAGTGKSTIALLSTSIWANHATIEEKSGASVATPARFAKIIGETTFPIIVSEPGEVFSRDDTVELIKNAVTSTIARGRYVQGVYVRSKALSPVIFTSNRFLPKDDALLRRFHVIYFDIQERKDREEAERFERIKREAKEKLRVIGDAILSIVESKGNIEFTSSNWQDIATELLKELYKISNCEIPEWVELFSDSRNLVDYEEELMSLLRTMLIEEVNNAYRMFPEKGVENNDFKHRLVSVIKKEAIPWLKERDGVVIITREIKEPLKKRVGELSMRSLATLLGGKYSVRRINKRNAKVIAIDLYTLLDFLQVGDVDDELEEVEIITVKAETTSS